MDLETHICPAHPGYKLVLDPSEIFPDDPGQGTPAMVYGPRGASGTYHVAVMQEEILNDYGCTPVPPPVLRWLESVTDYVDAFLDAAEQLQSKAGKFSPPSML